MNNPIDQRSGSDVRGDEGDVLGISGLTTPITRVTIARQGAGVRDRPTAEPRSRGVPSNATPEG